MSDACGNRWLAETSSAVGGRGPAYAARFDELAASGVDVHGEAALVCALRPAPARVLDAGCGTGRVAIELARRGYDVTGVDLDASMLSVARHRAPDLAWHLGDLATLQLEAAYDVVLLAGNVLIFLAPGTEAAVLERMATHLAPDGLVVAGFSLEPDRLDLSRCDRHAADAGLVLADRWSTWDRDPYAGGDYAISVYRHG